MEFYLWDDLYQDKVDWKKISQYQKLSKDFIREFQDKVYLENNYSFQELSEDSFLENQNKIKSNIQEDEIKLEENQDNSVISKDQSVSDVHKDDRRLEEMENQNNSVLSKDQVVSDVQNALWRNAAVSAVKVVKTPTVKLLNKYCRNNLAMSFVKSALNTNEGEAVLSYTLGVVIPYTPQGVKNEKRRRLAEEMRIKGFEVLIGELTSRLISPLMKPLLSFLDTVEE